MKYALILAGGMGSRMGEDTPKQFFSVGDKPIIIYTTEKFLKNKKIDKIFIVCPNKWIKYTSNLVGYYFKDSDKIELVEGGENRFESIKKGLDYISENYDITDDDIILTHDGVRPFINDDIINNNISVALEAGACTTAVKTIDTILISKDHRFIDEVPNRDFMFNVQTPQTFNLIDLIELVNKVKKDDYKNYTDLSRLYIENNRPIEIVEGSYNNIKITTKKDLITAKEIYEKQE